MPRNLENRGTCAYCGEVITKRSVINHMEKCPKRLESLHAVEASSRPVETLWHLRVQDAFVKDFWLDLEMNGSASLEKLDKYLRAIWLECCGHLSMFTIGGWQGDEISKPDVRVLIDDQFSKMEWRQIQSLAKENSNRMAQYLAQETRKEVPGISGPHSFRMEPLRQLTEHCINQVAFMAQPSQSRFFLLFRRFVGRQPDQALPQSFLLQG